MLNGVYVHVAGEVRSRQVHTERMAADGLCDQRLHNDLLGDVVHVNQLSDNIGALFMQDGYSDITLVVEEQRFVAHKVILAARSEYFR